MNRGQIIQLTWNCLTVGIHMAVLFTFSECWFNIRYIWIFSQKKITSLNFITLNAPNVYLQALTSSFIDSWKINTVAATAHTE